jgi:uncharacterized surface protein with fasciclin (FAS1) repeats
MKINYIPQTVLFLSMAALTPTVFSIETPTEKSAAIAKESVKKGSLTSMIADSVTFSTLTKALVAAELDATLGAEGEYTIFAPTDEAFGKLPEGTLAKLLLPENKEKLRSLLLFHVVPGKVLSTDLKNGDAKTLNGEKVKVDVSENKIEIQGNKVFSADVVATNGVMHTIGKVMIPKSLDGFAGLDD